MKMATQDNDIENEQAFMDFIKLNNDPYEYAIRQFGFEFTKKLLNKYRKGKAEHGDLNNGGHLDCQKEVNLEVLDILNYFIIDKVQNHKGE